MGNRKKINIKNRAYYFFVNMINIKDFDPNLLKIEKQSYRNINIYYIGYMTVEGSYYVQVNSVNHLYLIITEVDGYIEEKNGSKYLVFDSMNENNEVLKKYKELRDGIKNEIETINDSKKAEYDKDFMKIKFDTADNLPINKTLKFHNMAILARSVFEVHGKFYPQLYLGRVFVWVTHII